MQHLRLHPVLYRTSGRNRASARRHHRRKGQAIVEFALVSGPLFACIFGLIEFALIMTSVGAYNFGAKEGARLGSILGRQASNSDSQVISLIQSRTNGLAVARINQIEIYDADPYTGSVKSVATAGGSTVMDDVYTFNSAGSITSSSTPWIPDIRNDTLADADYLGVKITFQYTYLTAFLSGNSTALTLSAISIQRIEPLDYLNDMRSPVQIAARVAHAGPGEGLPPDVAAAALWYALDDTQQPLAPDQHQTAGRNEVQA